jgi:hypothetical protein
MRKYVALVLTGMIAVGGHVLFAGSVKSGPQPGEKMPGAFHPLHITGPDAGKRVCLYCKYGARPVALVFAREMTPALASLLVKIDAATAAHQDAGLASFTVFLGDPAHWSAPVKQLADANNIAHDVLTVSESAPESYGIAADAMVTVVLYHHHKVTANHAFRAGELDEKAIAAIVADVTRMLPPQ